MTRVIGISGKPGSNKLFYAFRIMRELKARGQTAIWQNFADPLYGEFNSLALRYINGESQDMLTKELNLGDRTAELFELLSQELGEYNSNYGFSRRNPSVRRALVVLGSNIRRKQNPAYFIEKFEARLNGEDFAIVTDLRYPNEADWIRQNNGMNIRLELVDSQDNSGGYKYNEGMADPSELALDDYPFFDYRFIREFFDGKAFGKDLEDFFELAPLKEIVR